MSLLVTCANGCHSVHFNVVLPQHWDVGYALDTCGALVWFPADTRDWCTSSTKCPDRLCSVKSWKIKSEWSCTSISPVLHGVQRGNISILHLSYFSFPLSSLHTQIVSKLFQLTGDYLLLSFRLHPLFCPYNFLRSVSNIRTVWCCPLWAMEPRRIRLARHVARMGYVAFGAAIGRRVTTWKIWV